MPSYPETKSDAATRLYPCVSFDTALPQSWVDAVLKIHHFDVRPHFVWGYPNRCLLGCPLPITDEGRKRLPEIQPGARPE